MTKNVATPLHTPPRLQILNPIFTIAFVVIAHVDAFHVQRTVVDLIGQGAFEKVFDFQIFDDGQS